MIGSRLDWLIVAWYELGLNIFGLLEIKNIQGSRDGFSPFF